MKTKRIKLFVDRKVQGPLLVRVTFYWLTALLLMALLSCIQVGLSSGAAPFEVKLTRVIMAFGPALITSLLILPLLLLDCIRYSNRFAGPMHRLLGRVRTLAETGKAEPIQFREGDFWFDMAEQFNKVSARVDRLQARVNSGDEESFKGDSTIAITTPTA